MKIITDFPPNFAEIEKVFLNTKEHQAVFCYGNTIFNPYGATLRPDLETHEQVHSRQQGDNPDAWWIRYIYDKEFRLHEEIEAYGTQYAFAKKHVKIGKLVEWAKDNFAKALSGPLYGNLLSYGEAESKIRNYAKTLII